MSVSPSGARHWGVVEKDERTVGVFVRAKAHQSSEASGAGGELPGGSCENMDCAPIDGGNSLKDRIETQLTKEPKIVRDHVK